jgi:hypothetical protein
MGGGHEEVIYVDTNSTPAEGGSALEYPLVGIETQIPQA